jgi:hypothetical protein
MTSGGNNEPNTKRVDIIIQDESGVSKRNEHLSVNRSIDNHKTASS